LASAFLALAQSGRADAVDALDKARRHVDRLVELDASRGKAVRFRELQGVIRFWEGDYTAARETFAAFEEDSVFCRFGVALVEYRQNHVQEARGLLSELVDELRTGDRMREFATATIALIDDHSDKEQVLDAFDRESLGRNWPREGVNGGVRAEPDGEALRVLGRFSNPGQPVFAGRVLPTAGNFLGAEITVTLGREDQSKLAGIEISTKSRGSSRGSGSSERGTDFRARLGVRSRRPYLVIEDGDASRARSEEQRKLRDPVELGGPAVAAGHPVRLELRVVQREGDKFGLQAYVDGEMVHERGIEKLRRKTSIDLAVDLLVEASQGARVDVTFDDFRLVRRREKR